jgi:hypothetical protein
MAELQGVGNVVRNSIVDTVHGTAEVLEAVEQTVSNSLVTVLRATGHSRGALTGALRGTREVAGALTATIAGVLLK